MSVPHQRKVYIATRAPRDKSHLYGTVNIDALKYAMTNLKESGFKLWCYFNKNQDNYFMELSQKDCEAWGIKRSSYYRGLEELEEKGFLSIEEDSNKYTFYEMPCENPSDIPNLGKIPKLGTDDARDRALNSQIGNTYSQIETQNSQIGKRYSQIE